MIENNVLDVVYIKKNVVESLEHRKHISEEVVNERARERRLSEKKII